MPRVPATRCSVAARISSARCQAASSVWPTIGRTDMLNRTARPCRAASARIPATRSAICATGSPQSMYTSACRAPTLMAAGDAPPKYSGIASALAGLT